MGRNTKGSPSASHRARTRHLPFPGTETRNHAANLDLSNGTWCKFLVIGLLELSAISVWSGEHERALGYGDYRR
jgi:hypothetical protein